MAIPRRSKAYFGEREETPPPTGMISPWVFLRSANKHPFIYQRMIRGADPAARPGDVVNVYDKGGALFGRALYNPRSQIALRMLAHGDVSIDDEYWRSRLERAIRLRRQIGVEEVTDAYRLVHAEGDGLSGLIAERYGDCLVFEFFSLGMFERRELIFRQLGAVLGPPTLLDRPDKASPQWRAAYRADEPIEKIEGFRAPPPGPESPRSIIIREHGVRYRVDLAAGHKTGFFCDQRDNRRRFAQFCRDAEVLDLCCYTGGFGLCAKILGGAREVTSVDLDEVSLEVAKENVNLNNTRVSVVHSDSFIYLRQLLANGRQFDAVVLDPPKFVPTRDSLEEGMRKYHDLNALAMRVVRPGGVFLTCSCSGLVSPEEFTKMAHRAGRTAGRSLQLIETTGAGADHPVMLDCPESAYLKALWLRLG